MFLFLLLIFFLPNPIHAAPTDFNITQDAQFQYFPNSSCQIEEKTTITNNFSQIYLKEYKINLNQKDISNIRAFDSTGNIIQNIEKHGDTTSISLKFNNPAVGKNQQTKFTLQYFVTKCATNKGKTWEISLPKFTKTNPNHQVNVTLLVPTIYGNLSTSSVKQFTYHQISNNHQYSFTIPDNNSPLIFIFGDHQLFDFSFDYLLENSFDQTINTQIALPPDTNYQTITYTQINPPPTRVDQDSDGNWLATYTLESGSTLTVNATGQVKITPPKQIPAEINDSQYLSAQEYWPVNSPQIQSLQANLSSPKDIYKFVVNYLNYDYQRFNSAKRLGALEALTNPQNALCTEFTDLFITIARSHNIPAREIQGFAYSQDDKIKPTNSNSDILHAWPQYYDSTTKTWVSVDPTWEKTTNGIDYFSDLDLNHFTFVIHGQKSNFPPPPGAYKNGQNVKTVNIGFSENEVNIPISSPVIKIFDNHYVIRNPNLKSLHNIQVLGYTFSLPPLGEYIIPKKLSIYNISSNISISSDETDLTIITVDNPSKKILPIIGIGFCIIFLSIIGIILTRPKHEKAV